jgi:hypothetical protein
VAVSANWFDARIICSFGSKRDVFPDDLVDAKKLQLFRACLLCLVGQALR